MTTSANQPGDLVYVDDDEADRLIVGRVWQSITGTKPVGISGGKALLEYLEACAAGARPWPRLILLDLNMPAMSGYEVLDQVKSDPRFRKVPIVVLSTSAGDGDVRACFGRHANGYVVKEIEPENLKRVLEDTYDFWFRRVEVPQSIR